MHPPIQHTDPAIVVTSAVAMIAAPVSLWIQLAPKVTVLVGTAGLIWYALLFTKEIMHWYRGYKRRHPN